MTLPLVLKQPYWAQDRHRGKVKTEEEEIQVADINALAWTYTQKTGELQQDGKHVATGYSGAGAGKNNPDMEQVHNVGPIPKGDWKIVGPPANTATHGPFVLRLEPEPATDTHGRDGFLMHGDSKESPGSASQGCVIMPRSVREQVWNSGDSDLKVVSDMEVDDWPVEEKK